MVVRDYLSWILDRPNMEVYEAKQKLHGDEYRKWYSAYSEENYRLNIEFVHSLGLKCDPDAFLVHRKTAEILMEEKVLRREQLSPVLLYDGEVPSGYTEWEMKSMRRPSDEYIEEKFREYEVFRLKERPRHVSTEKQALTELRRAKRDRKEAFVKSLKKEIAETLIGTAYEPMIPFYRISDGGSISDEYTLYPYAESLAETAEFHAAMEKEELLDEKPQGIVIAGCADGDKVLLKPDGTVCRMSHEVPEVYDEWQTLPQFIADTLEEAQ